MDSKIFNATRSPFLPANFPYRIPPPRPEATSAPQAPRESQKQNKTAKISNFGWLFPASKDFPQTRRGRRDAAAFTPQC